MYYNLKRFDGRGYSPAGCVYKYNMSIYVNTTATTAVRTVVCRTLHNIVYYNIYIYYIQLRCLRLVSLSMSLCVYVDIASGAHRS